MKISSAFVILAFTASLGLAACGQQTEEQAGTTAQAPDGNVEPEAGDIGAATREAVSDTEAAAREAAASAQAANTAATQETATGNVTTESNPALKN